MVAKLEPSTVLPKASLNLAKIHMVAKLGVYSSCSALCLNLAKIHMVAKQTPQQ